MNQHYLFATDDQMRDLTVKIIQIGLGLHWERTIAKHLHELRAEGNAVACPVGVELAAARDTTEARLACMAGGQPDEIAYVEPVSPYHMDSKTEAKLNRLVRKHDINAVIVSVPPEIAAR